MFFDVVDDDAIGLHPPRRREHAPSRAIPLRDAGVRAREQAPIARGCERIHLGGGDLVAPRVERETAIADVAQPALGAAGIAILRLLESVGIRGASFAGHSYGEFIALHAAGVIDDGVRAALMSHAQIDARIERTRRFQEIQTDQQVGLAVGDHG